MTDNTEILTLKGLKYIVGITAVNLGRSLEEPVCRRGQKTRKGNAGIVNAVFAAKEMVGHQGPVNERQSVVVNGVDLAEFGAHFADFQEQSRGKRRESDVTFLDISRRLAEGDKSIGAGLRIDDRLQTD